MAIDPTNLVASQLAGFTNASPQLPPGQVFGFGAPSSFVPGPFAGTPEGNIENMMLGMLGENAQGQGLMMNFIKDMVGSYDQLMKSYVGMLGSTPAGDIAKKAMEASKAPSAAALAALVNPAGAATPPKA